MTGRLVRTASSLTDRAHSTCSPFAARKAAHAASVGKNTVSPGVPTIGNVVFTSPALVCRSVTFAIAATNCSAVN